MQATHLLTLLLLLWPLLLRAQTTVTLTWQGRARTYLLYTPTGYAPGGPKLPLVVSLHPGLSNATNHAAAARWQDKGNTERFISVYPNGTSQVGSTTSLSWNAYAPSTGINVDDVGFLNALINQVTRQYDVDTTRMYMAGFSNGAWMTFRMGCDFTRRFAAIGPLSGSWKYGRDGRCDHGGCNGSPIPGTSPPSAEATVDCVPQQRIPIMFYRGTSEANLTDRAVTDPMVAYFWSRFNQCQTTPLLDNLQRNGDNIQRERYPACAQNAEVVVMNVVGNSHVWHASATDEFWNFFRRFRRAGTGAVLDSRPAAPAVAEMQLYPNPAAGRVTLRFTLAKPQAVGVELLDLQGRRLRVLRAAGQPLPAGARQLELDLPKLTAGLYLLRVSPAAGPAQALRLSVAH